CRQRYARPGAQGFGSRHSGRGEISSLSHTFYRRERSISLSHRRPECRRLYLEPYARSPIKDTRVTLHIAKHGGKTGMGLMSAVARCLMTGALSRSVHFGKSHKQVQAIATALSQQHRSVWQPTVALFGLHVSHTSRHK